MLSLLGGSWVVISRVISPLIWVISIVTLLITLLIATHEPPSTLLNRKYVCLGSVVCRLSQKVLGTVIGDTSPNHHRNSSYRDPT